MSSVLISNWLYQVIETPLKQKMLVDWYKEEFQEYLDAETNGDRNREMGDCLFVAAHLALERGVEPGTLIDHIDGYAIEENEIRDERELELFEALDYLLHSDLDLNYVLAHNFVKIQMPRELRHQVPQPIVRLIFELIN